MQALRRANKAIFLARSLQTAHKHALKADPLPRPDWLTRAEPLVNYRQGGYHPTRVGDVFGEAGRYQVLSKIGWGNYSTIWLARDTVSSDGIAVALKIMKAEVSYVPQLQEVEYLQRLRDTDPQNPSHSHIVQLLDAFPHDGPNGRHECIVTEVLGSDVDFLRKCEFPSRRMPLGLAKKITRDVLLALDYAHNPCGIIHTDVKLNNIMLQFPGPPILACEIESEFLEYTAVQPDGSLVPVTATTMISYPEDSYDDPSKWVLKLIDFGVACYADKTAEHWAPLICSPALRPPEVVVGAGWGKPVDVWSLGCCLYEMLVGRSLFPPEIPNEFVPEAQMEVFGPYPVSLVKRGKYSDVFFNEDGSSQEDCDYPYGIEEIAKIETDGAVEFSPDCVDFFKRTMVYEPSERATVRELLAHPFLFSVA